jgi:hypothetical protein
MLILEQKCILLLDYEFIFPKYGIKTTLFLGLKAYAVGMQAL